MLSMYPGRREGLDNRQPWRSIADLTQDWTGQGFLYSQKVSECVCVCVCVCVLCVCVCVCVCVLFKEVSF